MPAECIFCIQNQLLLLSANFYLVFTKLFRILYQQIFLPRNLTNDFLYNKIDYLTEKMPQIHHSDIQNEKMSVFQGLKHPKNRLA